MKLLGIFSVGFDVTDKTTYQIFCIQQILEKNWEYNESNLYSLPSIIRIMMKWRMRLAGHVARMGEKRNTYRLLVGKRLLGRQRRRWVDNIRMDLLGMGWEWDVDWIGLIQDRNRWRALVNLALNLWVS
jgi:hypothetical protein